MEVLYNFTYTVDASLRFLWDACFCKSGSIVTSVISPSSNLSRWSDKGKHSVCSVFVKVTLHEIKKRVGCCIAYCHKDLGRCPTRGVASWSSQKTSCTAFVRVVPSHRRAGTWMSDSEQQLEVEVLAKNYGMVVRKPRNFLGVSI